MHEVVKRILLLLADLGDLIRLDLLCEGGRGGVSLILDVLEVSAMLGLRSDGGWIYALVSSARSMAPSPADAPWFCAFAARFNRSGKYNQEQRIEPKKPRTETENFGSLRFLVFRNLSTRFGFGF